MTPSRRIVWWGLAGFALILTAGSACGQATDPRLGKVLADWEKRQQAVDSIRYVVKGQHVIPKGSLRDDTGAPLKTPAPAEDVTAEVNWLAVFDFPKGRHRLEVSEQVFDRKSNRFHPQMGIFVSNGKGAKSAMPRDRNTSEGFTPPPSHIDLVVSSGNMRGVPFQSEYMPLFFAHGLIRTMAEEVVPGKLRGKPDPEYLSFHGQGVHAGRPCIVIRTQTLQLANTSFDEFWTDPARDSAIVRYVMYSGKNIFNNIDIQYQQTPHGWLPERWTFTHYSGTVPTVIYRMRVESWQAAPPTSDADFDLPVKPGMIVEERVYDDTVNPLVAPKSATRVYRYGESGGKSEIPDPLGRPRDLGGKTPWWYWAVGGALAVAVIAASFWLVRKRIKAVHQ